MGDDARSPNASPPSRGQGPSRLGNALRLLRVVASDPILTLRLMRPRRIGNAIRAIMFREGNLGLLADRYAAMYGEEGDPVDPSLCTPDGHRGDVIFLPAIDWGFRFQRPQHLARELGSRGYRVFYISTVPLLRPRSGGARGYRLQGTPTPGVVLVQLASGRVYAPDLYQETLSAGEVAQMTQALRALTEDLGVTSPVLLVQQPFWWPLVAKLDRRRLLYDCLDHHAGFHRKPSTELVCMEEALAHAADVVVVTSGTLARHFRDVSPGRPTTPCLVIRNGCEFERFQGAPREKSSPVPLIGYVGAVSGWFDGDLLAQVARMRPTWRFEVYGATIGADLGLARAQPNVQFMGEIPYAEVPAALGRFDVAIIPFQRIPLTAATNPVKMYEYLAAGRPVVSTTLPELVGFEGVDVFCADTPDAFVAQLERALAMADEPERVHVRREWAREQDWSKRVDALLPLLQGEVR